MNIRYISRNWKKQIITPGQKIIDINYGSFSLNIHQFTNGFIFTWILHQIIMYSDKANVVAG